MGELQNLWAAHTVCTFSSSAIVPTMEMDIVWCLVLVTHLGIGSCMDGCSEHVHATLSLPCVSLNSVPLVCNHKPWITSPGCILGIGNTYILYSLCVIAQSLADP